jgi:hypothetical protein
VDYYSIAIETLAFLYEMPKSHDLGHVRSHVIRISNLPKIAKIDSVQLVVLYYIEEINREGEFISSSIILLNTLKRGEVFSLRRTRV